MLKAFNKAELTFDLEDELGHQGQNSKTYRAKDHQLDAQIVIKQVQKSGLNSTAEYFDEAKRLYASSHPNVVPIHYACEDADSIYIAMPLYKNGSTKSLITGQHISLRRAISLGLNIASGLHNVHSKGLVHFDIKPDNVLLSDRGEGLVSDFGLSKQLNFSGKAEQDRLYSKMMPPEGFSGNQFDRRFDIYQLGLTLYRLVNGDDHFYAQFEKYVTNGKLDRSAFKFDVVNERFPDRQAFKQHVPLSVRKIIRTCIKAAPADRYASAIDVANALAGVDTAHLDWTLTENPDGSRKWNKGDQSVAYELIVDAAGDCELRKSVAGGSPKRQTAGCQKNISEADLKKLFGAY